MKIALLVAAGGSGRRFGQPGGKQLFIYRDKPLLIHTLEKFKDRVAQLIVVLRAQDLAAFQEQLAKYALGRIDLAAGGAERCDSVRNGLAVLRADITHVFVHDGARPHVSPELFDRLRREAEIYDAVIPVLPVTDTIKVVKDGAVVLTPKRSDLYAAQTPQCFRRKTILQAYAEIDPSGCTDDAMLVEKLGVTVHTVPGDPENIKITRPADLPALKL
ncbi:MAG: 2-C-methyl-D-erythritol 4-phosphate cytidylyltransferase [Candidatus Margulisbacteria bacterium]|jgi:2-C-methyl-D-erythritol 4-phosphate cytidylyltransferase|nr:2-C-methyl-D-erythritol 4-phosphate cytidylyltransferase [Candidatus Margulisiibacteriota bacterium]